LHSLLRGHAFTSNWGNEVVVAYHRPRLEDFVWRFGADGRSFSAGERSGVYRVTGSTICLTIDNSSSDYCFGIGRASDGSLYRTRPGGLPPEPIKLLDSQLTGAKLRSAVVGKMFSFPKGEVIVAGARCNVFNADGTYAQCGDRVPIVHGRYVIERDQVCGILGSYKTCWMLFGGSTSGYLLQRVGPDSPRLERVCLMRWDQRMEPCH
jgi:hypothetical protein